MPYELPTAAQFKTRFPIFEGETDARLDALILEASASVDATWVEADYQPAIMYLAAHLLVTDNATEEDGGADDGEIIQSESFGPLSVSYRNNQDSTQFSSEYQRTSYGRRYLDLLRRNKPAIVAI